MHYPNGISFDIAKRKVTNKDTIKRIRQMHYKYCAITLYRKYSDINNPERVVAAGEGFSNCI